MERHNGIEFDPEGAFVYYDDAQRALDAEREKRLTLERITQEDVDRIATLQAQLRQVEHDAETYRKMHTVCTMNLALANNELTTLRQLVEAHAKQLTELTIIPIGCSREQELRWAQSIKDLRATLAAQDAPQPAPNERVEYARLELAALFSTPGAPTLEQAKLVCENKNPADAQCILNAYEALREAAQDAGVVIRRIVDDSFGSQMEMCSREDCGLQVVRPGQFQCLHPNCYDADQPHPTEERS